MGSNPTPGTILMVSQLGILFLIVFVFSFLFYLLKQPIISAYLISGFLIAKLIPFRFYEIFNIFSELGLIFLLFLVGLSLRLDFLKEIGKKALILGISQEIITIFIAYLFLQALGFSNQTALILAIAFSFSSTVIVMKIFYEKQVIDTFYGKLTVGFMIVQDIIAMILLALLPFLFLKTSFNWLNFLISLVFIFLLFLIFPRIIRKIEHKIEASLEILFIFSLAFLFLIVGFLNYFNLPLEIGALIVGLLFSNTNFAREVLARLSPLRDFFLITFFATLGFYLSSAKFIFNWQTLVISLFILIVNPLIVMIILNFLKVPWRANFIVSLTAGQISEFSFIFVNSAYKNNLIPSDILNLNSIVGLITIFVSSYLIYFGDILYQRLKPRQFKEISEKSLEKSSADYEVILFGCDRTGSIIKDTLQEKGINFLIVDYNPDIIAKLKKENLKVIYGDAGDIDLLYDIFTPQVKVIITTVPFKEPNLLIAKVARQKNPNVKLIGVYYHSDDKKKLLQAGFDYVFWPHQLGGMFLASVIKQFDFEISNYPRY